MPNHRKQRQDAGRSAPASVAPSSTEGHVEGVDTESRPSSDAIANRAYELYEQRGGTHGEDWNDWFQAERELTVRRNGSDGG
jgi:hypothetical protein